MRPSLLIFNGLRGPWASQSCSSGFLLLGSSCGLVAFTTTLSSSSTDHSPLCPSSQCRHGFNCPPYVAPTGLQCRPDAAHGFHRCRLVSQAPLAFEPTAHEVCFRNTRSCPSGRLSRLWPPTYLTSSPSGCRWRRQQACASSRTQRVTWQLPLDLREARHLFVLPRYASNKCHRLISAGLIPLTIAPFAAGSLNPLMDASLCALIIIHSHIGFQ